MQYKQSILLVKCCLPSTHQVLLEPKSDSHDNVTLQGDLSEPTSAETLILKALSRRIHRMKQRQHGHVHEAQNS